MKISLGEQNNLLFFDLHDMYGYLFFLYLAIV
jgi:hypothetical protein